MFVIKKDRRRTRCEGRKEKLEIRNTKVIKSTKQKIRNTKQIRNSNVLIFQTYCFGHFEFRLFDIASSFEIRYSDFSCLPTSYKSLMAQACFEYNRGTERCLPLSFAVRANVTFRLGFGTRFDNCFCDCNITLLGNFDI